VVVWLQHVEQQADCRFTAAVLTLTSRRVLSQLKRQARAMYSNPPVHGARIVAEVVNDEAMFAEWKAEMEAMSGRIKGVRQLLFDALSKRAPDRDWGFVLKQIGMFSFTGARGGVAPGGWAA